MYIKKREPKQSLSMSNQRPCKHSYFGVVNACVYTLTVVHVLFTLCTLKARELKTELKYIGSEAMQTVISKLSMYTLRHASVHVLLILCTLKKRTENRAKVQCVGVVIP